MREIKFRAWDNDMKEWSTAFDMDNDGVVYPTTTPYSNNPDIRIMQYTGLKDKNGVEIYEGDIVRIGDFTEEVTWSYKHLYDDAIDDGPPIYKGSTAGFHLDGMERACEVLGNIYENPELLAPQITNKEDK